MADSRKRQSFADAVAVMQANCRRNELTGCLEWQGHVNDSGKGYGDIKADGKYLKTHRLAYMAAYGEIPEGAHIRHACDNRICCEPVHLEVGTNYDNIVDKMMRDRSGKKLDIARVKEIKQRLLMGESQRELAEQFGVVPSIISRISTGRRWSHVLV